MAATVTQTKIKNNDMSNVMSFFQDDNIEAFDVNYQNKFLSIFIKDREGFTERIMDVVQPEYFDSYQKILLDYSVKFFMQYREIARISTIKDIIGEKEKGLNKEHLLGLIDKIDEMNIENIQYIKDSSYRFFKERSVKNCLFELVTDWKKHDYDSMKIKLENALKAGEPKDVGHDYFKDSAKRLKEDYRKPITFLPSLDRFIGGGLAPGECGFVLAQMGGGKSMFLVAGAANALLNGKKVVYYTLELSEEIVGQRFDACLNELPLKSVWDFPDTIGEKLTQVETLGGSLIIKKFPTGHATINTLMSHLKTLETHDNFIPDIIFIDYADLMKPMDNFSEKRHSLDGIYVGIRGMADELRIPIWSALQTNRSGLDNDRVTLKELGETLGAGKTADIIISLSRNSEEAEQNPLAAKVGILKNRNGQAGFQRDATFDSNRVQIHVLDVEPLMVVGKKPVKKAEYKNDYVSKNQKKDASVDSIEEGLNTFKNLKELNKNFEIVLSQKEIENGNS